MSTTESVRGITKKSLERVFVQAYLTGAQSNLTGNAWNKINLNAVINDLGGNFSIADKKFVVPVSGLYHIIGSVEFASVIADKRYLTAIYKNGTVLRQSPAHASLVGNIAVNVQHIGFLEADDYIELYAQPEVGGGTDTVDVDGTAAYTNLIIELVTKEGIRQ